MSINLTISILHIQPSKEKEMVKTKESGKRGHQDQMLHNIQLQYCIIYSINMHMLDMDWVGLGQVTPPPYKIRTGADHRILLRTQTEPTQYQQFSFILRLLQSHVQSYSKADKIVGLTLTIFRLEISLTSCTSDLTDKKYKKNNKFSSFIIYGCHCLSKLLYCNN